MVEELNVLEKGRGDISLSTGSGFCGTTLGCPPGMKSPSVLSMMVPLSLIVPHLQSGLFGGFFRPHVPDAFLQEAVGGGNRHHGFVESIDGRIVLPVKRAIKLSSFSLSGRNFFGYVAEELRHSVSAWGHPQPVSADGGICRWLQFRRRDW